MPLGTEAPSEGAIVPNRSKYGLREERKLRRSAGVGRGELSASSVGRRSGAAVRRAPLAPVRVVVADDGPEREVREHVPIRPEEIPAVLGVAADAVGVVACAVAGPAQHTSGRETEQERKDSRWGERACKGPTEEEGHVREALSPRPGRAPPVPHVGHRAGKHPLLVAVAGAKVA